MTDRGTQSERDHRTERAEIPVERGDVASQRDAARAERDDGRDIPVRQTSGAAQPQTRADGDVALLPDQRLVAVRAEWDTIQTGFVDRPRESVQAAHDLVGRLMEEVVGSFTRERDGLEGSWSRGNDDTENLRRTLQRYRSFFNRLLEL